MKFQIHYDTATERLAFSPALREVKRKVAEQARRYGGCSIPTPAQLAGKH